MIFFSISSLYAELFLLEHSLQDHFVFSLLILLCFSVEVQIATLCEVKLILSRKPILVPTGIKVNTCVMTHVLCLISEISFDWVSVLVACILLLSSEDTAWWRGWQDFKSIRFSSAVCSVCAAFVRFCKVTWKNESMKTIVQRGCRPIRRERNVHANRGTGGMAFKNLLKNLCSSDDRTEEAEAADWPVGTPSAHERQPPAACIRSTEAAPRRLCVWTERAVLAQRLHVMYTALSVSVTNNGRETL